MLMIRMRMMHAMVVWILLKMKIFLNNEDEMRLLNRLISVEEIIINEDEMVVGNILMRMLISVERTVNVY